jgi:hypothetical protein
MKRKYNRILTQVEKLDLEFYVDENYDNLSLEIYERGKIPSTLLYHFFMSREILPSCCGITEWGGFSFIVPCLKLKYIPNISEEDFKYLVAFHLIRAMKKCKKGVNRQLIMFNLIDNPPCESFEEIINEYFPDKFSEVRKFKNINTRNIVRVFLQNI